MENTVKLTDNAQGAIPLVIDVASADIMAVLLKLKVEIEQARGSFMKMVFFRATEAHLIADEIGELSALVLGDIDLLRLASSRGQGRRYPRACAAFPASMGRS